ncbi:hypothetical protein BDC45DRAFT_589841 [Circinella umbellata]|nr:hypothetical protein BDC45DRAFT_589841 [Circinella umbellata]
MIMNPLPTVRLLSSNEPYHVDRRRALNDPLLDPTAIHTVHSIDNIMTKYGESFVESIIIFVNHFIFVTAIDGFIHHNTIIDDAADESPPIYYDTPTANIKEKQFNGKNITNVQYILDTSNSWLWAGFLD